jgi:hypothetical protein
VLIEIAKAQPTAENFAAAIDTAQQIDDSSTGHMRSSISP